MTCNAVAVQSARLSVDASVIVHDDANIEALARVLAARWGIENVSVAKATFWVQFSDMKNRRSVLIFDRGGIEASNDDLESVKSLVEQATGMLVQARVRQAVAEQYQVVEEQSTPNGALVMSIEL